MSKAISGKRAGRSDHKTLIDASLPLTEAANRHPGVDKIVVGVIVGGLRDPHRRLRLTVGPGRLHARVSGGGCLQHLTLMTGWPGETARDLRAALAGAYHHVAIVGEGAAGP